MIDEDEKIFTATAAISQEAIDMLGGKEAAEEYIKRDVAKRLKEELDRRITAMVYGVDWIQ